MRKERNHITLRESDKEKLAAIHEKILAFPGNDHSLRSITKEFGLNRFFLTYGFKKFYGITLHQCVTQQRMLLAKKMLVETSKPLKEIAFECGYGNHASFSHVFKKQTGIAPSAYRERLRS